MQQPASPEGTPDRVNMLRTAIMICLAAAVLGQQRFGQNRFGQQQLRQPQPRQQQFGQQQLRQPQPRQQQFGQQRPEQQQQQLAQQGRQQAAGDPVPILRMANDQSPDGTFQWGYESADGAVAEAQGEQKQIGDGVGTVMQGSYSYTAPDGQLIEVRWIADENGFQPIGAHIPSQ